MSIFDSPMIAAMNTSLDGLWKREGLISDNLANYETPGYKRKYLTFEDELKDALDDSSSTRSRRSEAIQAVHGHIGVAENETMRLDGNNVDVEKENIEMARTQLNYDYSLRMLNDHFARLRAAINEGRK